MKVNEIFYSLQGEGHWTGTPAVFVRLSGCNKHCYFCDTVHYDGMEISEEKIAEKVASYNARHVVITGGEPLLQLTKSLIDLLHRAEKFVQIETNGSINPDPELLKAPDWITCSPKDGILPSLKRIDELKVVYEPSTEIYLDELSRTGLAKETRYLQPCDCNNATLNKAIINSCINYILKNPQWKLSLQTHKILNLQ